MMRFAAGLLLLSCAVCAQAAAPASAPATQPGPWIRDISHSPQQPHSGDLVRITAQLRTDVTAVALQYQLVDPGAYIEAKDPAYAATWVSVPMKAGKIDASATFTALLPGTLQKHRRLVRYRITAEDAAGKPLVAPESSDAPRNFAYFVYDGIPGWKGAIDPRSRDPRLSMPLAFTPAMMRRVEAYHLIGKKTSVENATWKEQTGGKEYKYTGTLVVDGIVYDHVRYRARGGVWRYAMGKNMWKLDLPPGQHLTAKDDFGRPFDVPWSKINLRGVIQQAQYGRRGEQGLYESVGFRLFNLAGVAAPSTHLIQLRIIDEAQENPPDQYAGDFWGLYLAIENEDGRFLKSHGLPDGNLYKMANGGGEPAHHGKNQPEGKADLDKFLATYGGNPPDDWWRENLNLPSYYSYRAIVECIHHYDIGGGKNYDYYRNPKTGLWQTVPWDMDLTWADHMYGDGEEPFKNRVLSRPAFQLEYQNRLREVRDLLYNPEQTGLLIDEYAALISDPAGGLSIAEADRRKWDYHPAMAAAGNAGQGGFYQAGPTKDFRGMAQLMKDYVNTRGQWIDTTLLNDPKIPATPTIKYTGGMYYPAKNLRFRAAPYQGANPFAAAKWRLAEVTPPNKPLVTATARTPRIYEISPVWESDDLKAAEQEITVPPDIAKPGRTYRVRVRMRDSTGRCSHWSAPLEFAAR